MNETAALSAIATAGSYDETRFNALRHGVLSRCTVLSWEDGDEYQVLLAALVAEHVPSGPTEEHLVEELAGVIWRKRRLRMAEAAIYRDKLRQQAVGHRGADGIAAAALLPITGTTDTGQPAIGKAIAATSAETARELRDVKRDQAMTQRALLVLEAAGTDAYKRALAALGDDTRGYWQDCLSDPPDDGLTYVTTPEALLAWLRRNWQQWFEHPMAELKHREEIRDQALGIAYATNELDVPARYEIHLDRKMERILAMLVRLRELRGTGRGV